VAAVLANAAATIRTGPPFAYPIPSGYAMWG
jgi:hypothetical protein